MKLTAIGVQLMPLMYLVLVPVMYYLGAMIWASWFGFMALATWCVLLSIKKDD